MKSRIDEVQENTENSSQNATPSKKNCESPLMHQERALVKQQKSYQGKLAQEQDKFFSSIKQHMHKHKNNNKIVTLCTYWLFVHIISILF
jgi:hypothetical protein